MKSTGDKQTIPPGTELEFTNQPRDAPSFFVEGLAGLAYANGVVKVNLFEQFMENDNAGHMMARFNLVLNIPANQFVAIEAVFREIATDIGAQLAVAEAALATKKEG